MVRVVRGRAVTTNGILYQIEWDGYPDEKEYKWEPRSHFLGLLLFQKLIKIKVKIYEYILLDL